MPNRVAYRKGAFRVVEADSGRITKNKAGTAVDGGGHKTRKAAESQARAINSSQGKK